MTSKAQAAHGRSLLARLSVAVWLGFVAYPLTAAYTAPGRSVLHVAVVSVVALAFCAAYIAYCVLPDRVRANLDRRLLLGFVGAVVGVVTFLIFYDGPAWDYSYVYGVWPAMALRDSRPWIAPLALAAVAIGAGALAGLSEAGLLGVAVELLGVGSTLYGVMRLIAANQALHRAQVQLAATAVAEERLRFSRDLHELLGHSLSVIALKC